MPMYFCMPNFPNPMLYNAPTMMYYPPFWKLITYNFIFFKKYFNLSTPWWFSVSTQALLYKKISKAIRPVYFTFLDRLTIFSEKYLICPLKNIQKNSKQKESVGWKANYAQL